MAVESRTELACRRIAVSVPSKSVKSASRCALASRLATSGQASKRCLAVRSGDDVGLANGGVLLFFDMPRRKARRRSWRVYPDVGQIADERRRPAVHVAFIDDAAHPFHTPAALDDAHLQRLAKSIGQLFRVVRIDDDRVAQLTRGAR